MDNNVFEKSKTFKDYELSTEILEALEKLKYQFPTKVQAETLEYTLKGKDMIALAETGSGKTLAFCLPIIESLLKNPKPYYALILAPTRELCLQIQEHLNSIGSSIGLKSVVIVGGLDLMSQSVALVSKKPHVIIATPGRILHHLEKTKGFNLQSLAYLVMDEADKLLNMNFEEDLDKIIEKLPKKRVTFLFSATMTNKVSKLQRVSLSNPVKIEISNSKHQTVNSLVQNYIFIPHKYKESYLVYLINEFIKKSTIIFVSTCKGAMKICLLLRNLGFESVPIHGQMTQVKRINSIAKFKANEQNILVATDVASRGLDIPGVDLVINYDLSLDTKDYVHRVGRTARAGKSGQAITIVTQYDVEAYQKIEAAIQKTLEEYKINESDVLRYHERVLEASKIAEFEIKKLLDKNNKIIDEERESKKNNKNQNSLKKQKTH